MNCVHLYFKRTNAYSLPNSDSSIEPTSLIVKLNTDNIKSFPGYRFPSTTTNLNCLFLSLTMLWMPVFIALDTYELSKRNAQILTTFSLPVNLFQPQFVISLNPENLTIVNITKLQSHLLDTKRKLNKSTVEATRAAYNEYEREKSKKSKQVPPFQEEKCGNFLITISDSKYAKFQAILRKHLIEHCFRIYVGLVIASFYFIQPTDLLRMKQFLTSTGLDLLRNKQTYVLKWASFEWSDATSVYFDFSSNSVASFVLNKSENPEETITLNQNEMTTFKRKIEETIPKNNNSLGPMKLLDAVTVLIIVYIDFLKFNQKFSIEVNEDEGNCLFVYFS